MREKEIDKGIFDQIKQLEEKYKASGQNLSSYLDGLLHADYLNYWNYIQLDTLLSLQTPQTDIPDEKIFILYHQITELYFKLIVNEMEQAVFTDEIDNTLFAKRLERITRYFEHLINSFDVMIHGMDQDQFQAFRMALLPASGFQSAQYRSIEIYATPFINLTNKEVRKNFDETATIEELYEHIYWKSGATELASGKKSLTLRQFESKYDDALTHLGQQVKGKDLWSKYKKHYSDDEDIIQLMKSLDQKANVDWPLQHFKSASKYLQKDRSVIGASGGTNWQKYLPPRHQKIIFYPDLWSAEEVMDWGIKFKKVFEEPYA